MSVRPGQHVRKGDTLLVMESSKLAKDAPLCRPRWINWTSGSNAKPGMPMIGPKGW